MSQGLVGRAVERRIRPARKSDNSPKQGVGMANGLVEPPCLKPFHSRPASRFDDRSGILASATTTFTSIPFSLPFSR
jgi:hypothetical protein